MKNKKKKEEIPIVREVYLWFTGEVYGINATIQDSNTICSLDQLKPNNERLFKE